MAIEQTRKFEAMKKQFKIILLLLLLGSPKVKGQILYTNLIPDIIASGLPLGTTDSDFVDVNQDGQNDFVIVCSTWFNFIHQNCCWCYYNQIAGLTSGNGIAQDTITGSSYNCGRVFLDSGICVGNNYAYQNVAVFSASGPCAYCGPPDTVIKYFPFRMEISSNLSYGWLRIMATGSSIALYDMAINLTPNDCITTGQTVTKVSDVGKQSEFSFYPNPTNGKITINLSKKISNGKVQIINVIGEGIYEKYFYQTSQVILDLTHLTRGIYFISVFYDRISSFKKLIVAEK